MANQEKNPANGDTTQATKPAKLELAEKSGHDVNGHSESGLALRSDLAENEGEIQVAELYSEAGLRPIATSSLEVYATILNNRPISASHLHVANYALPGHRPIFTSNIVIRDDLTLPGGRPIIASNPKLLEASLLPGGRPIASNEIDDSETLMGFLD